MMPSTDVSLKRPVYSLGVKIIFTLATLPTDALILCGLMYDANLN